jgi:tetratricopeptide (TPR) repeat protein
MQSLRRMLFPFSVLLLVLVCCFGLSTDPVVRNMWHATSLRQLWRCVDPTDEKIGGRLWMGIEPAHNASDCLQALAIDAPIEIAAIALWWGGRSAPADALATILPKEKAEIYEWRNQFSRNQSDGYPDTDTRAASDLAVSLAIGAWQQGYHDQAIALVRGAILHSSSTVMVSRLLDSVSPRSRDEFEKYERIRILVASTAPDYTRNYIDWFELAVVYEDWKSASKACGYMQQHSASSVEALICGPRLAFYSGKYGVAYEQLNSILDDSPHNAIILTWTGLSARQAGNCGEAVKLMERAIQYELRPAALLNLYWQIGDCQNTLGEKALAHQAYKKALNYDLDHRYEQQLTELLMHSR